MLVTKAIDGFQFDYIYTTDPTTSVNPKKLYAVWLNITTGIFFICTDNAINANVWASSGGGGSIHDTNPDEFFNPPYVGFNYTNYVSGEMFICTDNTTNANYWQGQLGTQIKPYSMMSSTYDYVFTPTLGNGNCYIINGSYHQYDGSTGHWVRGVGLSNTVDEDMADDNSSYKFDSLTAYNGNYIGARNGDDSVVICDGLTLHETGGTILQMPFSVPYCAIVVNGNLVVMDYSSKKVYTFDGLSAVETDSFYVGPDSPRSIAWDGRNLVAVYNGVSSNNVKVFEGLTSTNLKTFTYYSNKRPNAVSYHDGHIYIYSGDENAVRRFKNENEL